MWDPIIWASIVFIWICIVFLDTIFKSCMLHPYIKALYTAGLEIKPFAIFWRITRFNRYINQMGLYRPRFLKIWFSVGAVVTSVIFFPCISLYIYKLFSLLLADSPEEFESSKLVPVIPGYNFPLSYWKLYGCVLFVCSIIHEFGHALAASRLGVGVDSFGFALFLFVPLAFVNVRLDQFRHSSRWQQMYVFCAGIWHNVVLSLSCLLVLSCFGLLVSPLYNTGDGVQVLYVNELTELNHPVTGLQPKDHIYALGSCAVKDFDSWNSCLEEIEDEPSGLCVPSNLLYNNSEAVPMEKCTKRTDQLFFSTEKDKFKVGVCLHARTAVQFYKICTKTLHKECDHHSSCVVPYLPQSHRFIIIERHPHPPVLYVGLVNELRMDVKVSELFPKWKFLPPDIPEMIREFLQYVLIFSNGLACLNVLPIFSLDGKFVLENLIHILLFKYFCYEDRKLIIKCISAFTSGVVCAIIFVTASKMVIFYM